MMEWKNKKYILSKGLAFYPELEAIRLKEEARKGWALEKVSWAGFYRLRKSEPEECEVTIDFYSGKNTEKEDYLELFQLASWEPITCYRQKYIFFKAPLHTPSVYTDEETYGIRIKKEYSWFLKNTGFSFLFGIGLLWLLKLEAVRSFFEGKPVFLEFSYVIGTVALLMPLLGVSLIIYYKAIYPKRKSFYNHPDIYAKRQIFGRDIVISMIMGGIIGALTGVVFGLISGY